MSLLGKYTQQPSEVLDYDMDFTDWFVGRSDTPSSVSVVVETGITLVSSSLTGNVAKVTLSGGVAGVTYKITVRLTTSSGIVREGDFAVKIKET